ncbi:unnamed protein product [Cuscuta campestris]|uniref:SGNH hydrolase-type esterase domain-containing protein n=1 Tax=Cuscuta campestris TaxID=132261 RepID=A0A484LQW7_9ASTE|nr:unnamed protein product [Cuscuta campestris]
MVFLIYLGEKLGTEPILPYLNPELDGEKLLVGANFASAGVGILDDTGIQFVNIIRIHQQLDYFAEYQERLNALVGSDNGTNVVKEALVLISLGGNDFVNNYFLVPFSARSRQYALPDYVVFIISEYKNVLERLYNLGARTVIVTGTGPLGCAPAEMAQHSIDADCASELQRAASLYNPQLVQMVEAINNDIGYDVFVAANAHKMHMDFITSPQTFGFVTSRVACCGQGPYNGLGFCTPLSNLCSNREEYAFWDAFHPSEKANRIIVDQMMVGSNDYMHPINLSTMLTMVLPSLD